MSTTDEWDDWWNEEHPNGTGDGEIESDCDEIEVDSYDDPPSR